MSGTPSEGRPLSMVPTMSRPWSSRCRSSTARMPEATATSDPGTAGATRRRPSTTASDATPTSTVSPWIWLRFETTSHAFSKKSPEPFSGEKAEPREPGEQRDEPGDDRERGGGDDEGRGTRGDDVGDGGSGQGGGGRHRPGDQVPRASQRRVEQQRAGGGVEPDDLRDPGDRRLGQRLGHEHRPHREAGDEVAAQPFAPVAAQRREEPARGVHGGASRGPRCRRPAALPRSPGTARP